MFCGGSSLKRTGLEHLAGVVQFCGAAVEYTAGLSASCLRRQIGDLGMNPQYVTRPRSRARRITTMARDGFAGRLDLDVDGRQVPISQPRQGRSSPTGGVSPSWT